MVQLLHGDCLDMLKTLPDKSVDLVLTDPPYNIGKADWDKIDGYIDWCALWIAECARVLKDNGSLYIWHNDMPQIAMLMERIRQDRAFSFVSFCVWDKGDGYRAQSWKNRDPQSNTALRSWFNRCEYCLEYARASAGRTAWDLTGLDRVNSDPACYKPLKDWYAAEKERLGITELEIAQHYTSVTGRKPYMLHHYFQNSQFEIPTREIWESVYMTLGFGREYEELRYYHQCDERHCNVWARPALQSCQKESGHPCEKPVDLLRRIIRVSCRPGGVVLDCFMGGGSTGAAAIAEKRDFIGIELDDHWYAVASERIRKAQERPEQIGMFDGKRKEAVG